MEELDALIARMVEVANDVLQERRTPSDGARELWRLWSEMSDLPDTLPPFVALASEWEDHSAGRAEFDREIMIEMERLRRRLGR
jgi:hypothetical protein